MKTVFKLILAAGFLTMPFATFSAQGCECGGKEKCAKCCGEKCKDCTKDCCKKK
jgi:hypothetical protein